MKEIRAAREIAKRLYEMDPRAKPAFGWIGRQEKLGRDPTLILRAMMRLEEKVMRGGPAGSVARYLGGTLRSMREKTAPRAQGSQPASVGEIIKSVMPR